MTPSLHTFRQALLTPDLSFATLATAHAATDANGMPRLQRSTRFAEAEIDWQERRWLLSMPLNATALPRIERMVSRLRRLNSPWLVEYRILPDELHWEDSTGQTHTTSLVLQALPEGLTFDEALRTQERATLRNALDDLERELDRMLFRHNNLKASNLRWVGGRLLPIRYHDASIGSRQPTDAAAFEQLRRQADTAADRYDTLHDTTSDYTALPQLTGHLWTGNLFEGLFRVEDPTGFGFVDTDNRPVIASQYLWAGDFHEGRAEVETPTGMGLIDRSGAYVIPPQYEIVEYDPATSVSLVRRNGLWARFDYLGRRLTPFSEGPEQNQENM